MNIAFASAAQLASLIKRRKISVLEAVDFYIARIEAFDDAINAVVVRDFDRARARAKALDRGRSKLAKLPALYGVPMTVKESFDIAGLPTTWGVKSAAQNIAKTDAVAIERFKDAGAVILGKTNVPVMLADWQSFNEIYGTTSNPWDLSRSPGGSSGGSAASMAAGFAALDAGSDIGASLRDPAHYCGIYAHKPTYGICAMKGHSLTAGYVPPDISCIGPMARTAKDLALGLGVMAGGLEEGWQLALPKSTVTGLKGLRVAIMAEHEICPVESEISDSLLALGKFLKKAGAKVSYTARPGFDANEAHENYMLMLNSALSARMPDAVIARLRSEPDSLLSRGVLLEHRIWLRHADDRGRMKQAWRAFFDDYDVLISPVASSPAVKHDHSANMGERYITVNGTKMNFGQQLFWAGYSCNFGLPSTAAPLGMTAEGLPYGMQIIGAPFADYSTIAVAALLEEAWVGFVPPPMYDV
jgi:amidase